MDLGILVRLCDRWVLILVDVNGQASRGAAYGTLFIRASPLSNFTKVLLCLISTHLSQVAPSRSKRLSRTNSLGRSEAAEEATRLSIRRAHRGSRSMDLSDAHLSFERAESIQVVNGKNSVLNGKEFRWGGTTGELLRLDGSSVGQSGGLFRGLNEDVRDSFQALCNAHDVVRFAVLLQKGFR
jgi:hypothetical protein